MHHTFEIRLSFGKGWNKIAYFGGISHDGVPSPHLFKLPPEEFLTLHLPGFSNLSRGTIIAYEETLTLLLIMNVRVANNNPRIFKIQP